MDIDNDGDLDLITGSYSYTKELATIYLIEKSEKGYLPPQKLLFANGSPINPGKGGPYGRRPNALAPFAADWDDDGDLDVLIGSMDGEITLVRNVGSKKSRRFSSNVEILKDIEGGPVMLPGRLLADPFVIDWDNDGRKDLLIGGACGGVYFYRNIAKTGPPKLTPIQVILGPSNPWYRSGREVSIEKWQQGRALGPKSGKARIFAYDSNGDSILDLLVGDRRGHIWLYLGK